jgi:hypothetical protein
MGDTRGERVWKSLLSPSTNDVAASEWLLLFTIFSNKSVCLNDIRSKIAEIWEDVQESNPNFYLVWSTGYDMEKELMRYEDIGMLEITEWKNKEPCWQLTGKGIQVLYDWRPNVEKILGSITASLRSEKS